MINLIIAYHGNVFVVVSLDSQYSVYSNESSPSIVQENQIDSPAQECSQNSDNFSKLQPGKF